MSLEELGVPATSQSTCLLIWVVSPAGPARIAWLVELSKETSSCPALAPGWISSTEPPALTQTSPHAARECRPRAGWCTQDPTLTCSGACRHLRSWWWGVLLHGALPPPLCSILTHAEPLLLSPTLGNPLLGSCLLLTTVHACLHVHVHACTWVRTFCVCLVPHQQIFPVSLLRLRTVLAIGWWPILHIFSTHHHGGFISWQQTPGLCSFTTH